jgi:hypothetical protein
MATAPLGHASALHMARPFLRPRRMVATAALLLERATAIRASAVSPAITATAPQRHASTARSIVAVAVQLGVVEEFSASCEHSRLY